MPPGVGYGKKARGRGRAIRGGGQNVRLLGGNLSKRGLIRGSFKQRPGRGRRSRGVGSGGTTAPGAGQRGGKGRAGISAAGLPGPGGRQLASRVSSGKITQEQADRTMKQRQTLAKAFGKNWRDKISQGGKSFASVRKGLAKKPKDPRLAALNKKLLASRGTALEAARAKAGGSGGTKAPAGRRRRRSGGVSAAAKLGRASSLEGGL